MVSAIFSFRLDKNGAFVGKIPGVAYLGLFIYFWGVLAMQSATVEYMGIKNFTYFNYAAVSLGVGCSLTAICTFLWWHFFKRFNKLVEQYYKFAIAK